MTPAAELRDLVQQLAHRHEVTVIQHGRRIGNREQRPLLTLLAEASTPTISAAGRGGAFGPRIAFDPAASELHTAIRSRIHRWAVDAGVPRHWTLITGAPLNWRDAAALLTTWHARVLHTDPYDWIPTLHSWASSINTLVTDPPRRTTLDAPCPECGQRWAANSDGERIVALQVSVRDLPHGIETLCRNCGATTTGLDGAEQLAELLKDTA